jgi:glycosyltransferase involved in cell wall biosynthesis
MNLLVFNLRTDVGHTSLGFTTSWINGLAQRCDRVFVVTMETGKVEVERNVTVLPISAGGARSKIQKLGSFYRIVFRLLRNQKIDACFAHMTPLLAALFSPLARLYNVPVLLWYAHGTVSLELRIAHSVVERCVTSTPEGFPLKSTKLRVLSQGIDIERFSPQNAPGTEYDRTLIAVGRLAPRKHVREILEAVSLVRRQFPDVRLEVFGGPMTTNDVDYSVGLRVYAVDLGIESAVKFVGAVPFDEIAGVYARGLVFVNLSETGSLDKAILEGMASGCIPISRNRSFAALARANRLDLLVPAEGADAVAAAITRVLTLPKQDREALQRTVREVVVQEHSLSVLLDRIMEQLRELCALPPSTVEPVDTDVI